MLMSARLTTGNKGTGYTLRQPRGQSLLGRVFERSGYSFTVPDRDENGWRALSALEERGVNLVANAAAQAVDHVHGFFAMLRVEVGFYVGCLNLAERLAELGEPTAFPAPVAPGELALSARGLYDVCLRLTTSEPVVGNDVDADHKSLVMITGANQGGKSTFLRSVGLAQLMTQAGMFVGADSLRVNVCDGVFTHYKREEDETMESGKLDEELGRMSQIADHIAPNCLLLCNESFAATNEREGSEIARQVVTRAARGRGQGAVRDPHVRPRGQPSPPGARHRTCSCVRRGDPTALARSRSPRASRCPPATARTPTGRSSASRSIPGWPRCPTLTVRRRGTEILDAH